MTKQEYRIELQRLRNLAFSIWEAQQFILNSKWGAVQFLDEQLAVIDKEIKNEEIKKREAEIENFPKEQVVEYGEEASEDQEQKTEILKSRSAR